jgi:Zn-dependent M28 family amino/carboxypeptidase
VRLTGKRLVLAFSLVGVCALSVRVATDLRRRAVAPPTGVEVTHHVNRDRLMADLRQVASAEFEGRATGTPGGLKARAWVADAFEHVPLEPAGSAGFLEPFATKDHGEGANVAGRLAGSEPGLQTIVVSAHYDHLGRKNGTIYYGADDNASGTVTLAAAARSFAAHKPRHTMVFVAFDGEEIGLLGSKAFVKSPLFDASRTAIDVNLDMVSRNDRNEIYASGVYQSPWLKPIVMDVQRRSGVTIKMGHDRPKKKRGDPDDWTDQSDHGAFNDVHVPFLYFGVEDHADYHKPTDTADKIDPTFFGNAADMIVEALVTLDRKLH